MGSNSFEHALTLFGDVVKKEGELKWAARNEQAVIERKLSKPQDALAIYDEVLKGGRETGRKTRSALRQGRHLF